MAARTTSHQPVRCAIYTRQSVVRGGGDPALASCVLQREKCFDFVRAHERHGWCALDERFDDEGYSGATVERPGLERLVELIGNDPPEPRECDRVERGEARGCERLWVEIAGGAAMGLYGLAGLLGHLLRRTRRSAQER